MQAFIAVIVFLLGLGFGSFANVLIYRIPRRLSFVASRSYCPNCGKLIRAYDDIPLLSYLLLRGCCRDCGERISFRYPLVELTTGLLFLGVFWHNGWEWRAELLPQLLLVTVLVVISGIDLDEQIIPNRIVIPGLIAGLIAMGIVAGVRGDAWIAGRAAIGAAIGAGFLGLIALAVPRGMGMGDAKLAAFIGAFLGFYVLAALLLAGSIVGIALIGFGRRGRRDRIPFGPFLATGAVLALFWGEPLYRFYRSLFNLG